MAIVNSETVNINLGDNIDLNRNNTNIRDFNGFTENNGVIYDGSLHNLSFKNKDAAVIINSRDETFSIRNNSLYDGNDNEIAQFSYPHFVVEDVSETHAISTVDYYEDPDTSVILTSKQVYVNGDMHKLPDEIFNIISSKIIKDKIFLVFKDNLNNNFFFVYDYTAHTYVTYPLPHETYSNKIIYDPIFDIFSLLESDYSKAFNFKIENSAIKSLSFSSNLKCMFAPKFLLGDGRCAALYNYQNTPNEQTRLEAVFKILEVVGTDIMFDVDYDASGKSFSGFFAENDKTALVFNNGFYSHSSELKKSESLIFGTTTKEKVGLSFISKAAAGGNFAITGKMEPSGLISYDFKTNLVDYFRDRPLAFLKDGVLHCDVYSYVGQPHGTSTGGRYIGSWRKYWNNGVTGATEGWYNIKFLTQPQQSGVLRINLPDANNRKAKDIKINNTVIGTVPTGTRTYDIPITILPETAIKETGQQRLKFHRVGEYFIANTNFRYSAFMGGQTGGIYWRNGTAMDFTDTVVAQGSYSQSLAVFVNGTRYNVDADFRISVDDVEWTMADIFQDMSFSMPIQINVTTDDGFTLYLGGASGSSAAWLPGLMQQNGSWGHLASQYGWEAWGEDGGYIIGGWAGAEGISIWNVQNSFYSGYLANNIQYNLTGSSTGNYEKTVQSTTIQEQIGITEDINCNTNTFLLSEMNSYTAIGDGATVDGKNWQYGNVFKKGDFYLLFNNDTLSGISYSQNSMVGTLITPWFSVDEDFDIKTYENTLIYRDKNGLIKRIKIMSDGRLHYDYILDKYLIINTTDYLNCVDLDNLTFHHYASDYNGRLRPVGITSLDELNTRIKDAYFISSVNANYEITGGLSSMIRNPVMSEYIYGDMMSFVHTNCGGINNTIDIYTSKDGAAIPKYKTSIRVFEGLSYATINRIDLKDVLYPIDTSGNMILNPSITTKFSKNYFKNFVMIMEGSAYIGITQGVNNYLLYYLASEFDGLTNIFNIQGLVYGVTRDKIYRLTIQNGVLVDYDVVAKISGLQYIGSVISEALFFSPINNNIYSFTGDNNLRVKTSGSRITEVFNTFYNTSAQDLYVSTNIGLLIFSLVNNYLVPKIGDIDLTKDVIKDVFFPSDSKYIISYKDGNTTEIKFADEDYEFTTQPLTLSTSFYGTANARKTRCSAWNITLKTENIKKEGVLLLKSETLTDRGIQTGETKIKILKKNWDPVTKTYFVRYQPKYQAGAGNRLLITSDFPISALSVDVTPDGKQLSHNNC